MVDKEDKNGQVASSPKSEVTNGETKTESIPTSIDTEQVKKVATEYEDYKSRVEPVLQTILADPNLYKTVLESHKKRLGVQIEPEEEEDKPVKTETKKEPSVDVGYRGWNDLGRSARRRYRRLYPFR